MTTGIKSLFTWKWRTPIRWGNPLRWGNLPDHVISNLSYDHPTYHVNVITLKWEIIWTAKQVTSPTWRPPPICIQAPIAINPLFGQPLQRNVRCVNDLFHSGAVAVYNESLGNDDDDDDGNENGKKAIGLDQQNNNSARAHAFMYISLPLLHDYNVKVPSLTFCQGREQKTTTFFFFSWTYSPLEFNSKQICQHLKKLNEIK